jgi:phage shock protein PspC (stress-responsive transcriptional regulator)
MQVNRRLYRCRHDRRLGGVAAGVAEFFGLDPTLVRLLWVVSIFFGGISLLLYFGMWIIVPLEPVSADESAAATGDPAAAPGDPSATLEGHRHVSHGDGRWTTILGGVLILFGTLALVDRFLPALDVEHFVVPAIMIGIGAYLVTSAVRREPMES